MTVDTPHESLTKDHTKLIDTAVQQWVDSFTAHRQIIVEKAAKENKTSMDSAVLHTD